MRKHYDCLANPQKLNEIPVSNRGNILKTMVNLAKFLGIYEDYKAKLKQFGIHWINNEDSFSSFLRIINNQHSNLGAWYSKAKEILRDDEKLWLRFNLITGMRKEESITSFNLIIKLSREGKLNEYYNSGARNLGAFQVWRFILKANQECLYINSDQGDSSANSQQSTNILLSYQKKIN